MNNRWKPFDGTRNWPDLGERFISGERQARKALYEAALNSSSDPLLSGSATSSAPKTVKQQIEESDYMFEDRVADDKRDLDWATVLKRTFEAFIRGERPNMYGEWVTW